MSWQDVLIGFGQFVMAAALLPSIQGKTKPALGTSLTTALLLSAFGVAFLTLGLWLSLAGVWTAAAGWWVLAWQEYSSPEYRP